MSNSPGIKNVLLRQRTQSSNTSFCAKEPCHQTPIFVSVYSAVLSALCHPSETFAVVSVVICMLSKKSCLISCRRLHIFVECTFCLHSSQSATKTGNRYDKVPYKNDNIPHLRDKDNNYRQDSGGIQRQSTTKADRELGISRVTERAEL